LCKNIEGDPATPGRAATTCWRSSPDATLSSRFSFAGLASLVAEYNKRYCPTFLGNKPSRHRGQRYVGHHALTEQPKEKNGKDESGQGGCIAGKQCRPGQNGYHQSYHALGLHNVNEAPKKWNTKRACQRSEHIKSPEFPMRQPKHCPPFRNRGRDEIRLSKAGKVREYETAGDPTKVVLYKLKH